MANANSKIKRTGKSPSFFYLKKYKGIGEAPKILLCVHTKAVRIFVHTKGWLAVFFQEISKYAVWHEESQLWSVGTDGYIKIILNFLTFFKFNVISFLIQDMGGNCMQKKILYLLDFIFSLVLTLFLLVLIHNLFKIKSSAFFIGLTIALFIMAIVRIFWTYRRWRQSWWIVYNHFKRARLKTFCLT